MFVRKCIERILIYLEYLKLSGKAMGNLSMSYLMGKGLRSCIRVERRTERELLLS